MKITELDKYFAFHIEELIDALENGDYQTALIHAMRLNELITIAINQQSLLN